MNKKLLSVFIIGGLFIIGATPLIGADPLLSIIKKSTHSTNFPENDDSNHDCKLSQSSDTTTIYQPEVFK